MLQSSSKAVSPVSCNQGAISNVCGCVQVSADFASLLPTDDKSGPAMSKIGSLEELMRKSADEKQAGRSTPKPQATEVWLLLEYCNKGTLRVCLCY